MQNLTVLVNYEFVGKICEDFLFCKFLPTHTKTAALSNTYLDSLIQEKEINCSRCVRVSTDDARSVRGTVNSLISLVKLKAPHVVWTHCSIHHELLL